MSRIYLHLLSLFLILFLLQIGVFNSIHLFGVATPVLFVYYVLKLPAEMNRSLVLLLAAAGGFLIDLFSYTLGLNMLALTVVGFARFYALKFFGPREFFEVLTPSFLSFGKGPFLAFCASLVFLNLLILFGVESLSLFNPLQLSLRILGSFLLSMLILYAIEVLIQSFYRK